MKFLDGIRSLDRYGWAMLAALLLGVPVALLAFLVLVMLAGPLMAVLLIFIVGVNLAYIVRSMRRHYRAHRAPYGLG